MGQAERRRDRETKQTGGETGKADRETGQAGGDDKVEGCVPTYVTSVVRTAYGILQLYMYRYAWCHDMIERSELSVEFSVIVYLRVLHACSL